jgi:hypothetical protein
MCKETKKNAMVSQKCCIFAIIMANTGFNGMMVSFVGRSSIAFHNLPIVRRPYGTLQH